MSNPWLTIDRDETVDGLLELRQRGGSDFLITINGRVLMNSHANRSEILLSKLACDSMNNKQDPSVLIGGLGMGTALIWQHGTSEKHEVRLDLIELGASVLTARLEPGTLGDVQVRMVIDSPKHGRRTAEKRMTREQLLELHLDPAPFIEKALADE